MEFNNLNLDNLRSKTLVILSGQMRSYKFANIYSLKQIKKFNPTIIVTTWKNQPPHSEDHSKIKKFTNKNVSSEDIYSIYKPLLIDIEENNFEITSKILGEKNKYDFIFPYRLISTRFQFYKFNRIYNILNKLKDEYGITFNKILFIRPDIAITSKINLERIKDGHIYFEDTLGNWNKQRSDRIFYGKYNEIMLFLSKICFLSSIYLTASYIFIRKL